MERTWKEISSLIEENIITADVGIKKVTPGNYIFVYSYNAVIREFPNVKELKNAIIEDAESYLNDNTDSSTVEYRKECIAKLTAIVDENEFMTYANSVPGGYHNRFFIVPEQAKYAVFMQDWIGRDIIPKFYKSLEELNQFIDGVL